MTNNSEADGLYPMRVVARLTGLSPHTIRVWERRYGAVVPERTAGNTRRYSSADVRKLSRLREATELGYPIREVAGMATEALTELVDRERKGDPTGTGDEVETGDDRLRMIERYLARIGDFDLHRSMQILSRAAAFLAPQSFIMEVALPIMRESGDRWESGAFTVAHEHAVTAQMRGVLDALMRQAAPLPGAPQIVVGTPSGHMHEFGALAAAQLAAARGLEPVYLGPDVPEDDVIAALEGSRADLVLLALLIHMDPGELRRLDDALGTLSAHADVWVGSPPDHPAAGRVDGVRYFSSFPDLDLALTERAGRRAG